MSRTCCWWTRTNDKCWCCSHGPLPLPWPGPLPGQRQHPFFWRMLVSQQAPPEQRHQRRECFGNSLLLNRKVPLTSSNKWMNWRGRQKRLKESLRSSRYSNRRSTISYVRISCASTLLLVSLSRQLCWLDVVNICGLMCTHVLVWWGETVSGLLLMCKQ